jgi:hypothetical protein
LAPVVVVNAVATDLQLMDYKKAKPDFDFTAEQSTTR